MFQAKSVMDKKSSALTLEQIYRRNFLRLLHDLNLEDFLFILYPGLVHITCVYPDHKSDTYQDFITKVSVKRKFGIRNYGDSHRGTVKSLQILFESWEKTSSKISTGFVSKINSSDRDASYRGILVEIADNKTDSSWSKFRSKCKTETESSGLDEQTTLPDEGTVKRLVSFFEDCSMQTTAENDTALRKKNKSSFLKCVSKTLNRGLEVESPKKEKHLWTLCSMVLPTIQENGSDFCIYFLEKVMSRNETDRNTRKVLDFGSEEVIDSDKSNLKWLELGSDECSDNDKSNFKGTSDMSGPILSCTLKPPECLAYNGSKNVYMLDGFRQRSLVVCTNNELDKIFRGPVQNITITGISDDTETRIIIVIRTYKEKHGIECVMNNSNCKKVKLNQQRIINPMHEERKCSEYALCNYKTVFVLEVFTLFLSISQLVCSLAFIQEKMFLSPVSLLLSKQKSVKRNKKLMFPNQTHIGMVCNELHSDDRNKHGVICQHSELSSHSGISSKSSREKLSETLSISGCASGLICNLESHLVLSGTVSVKQRARKGYTVTDHPVTVQISEADIIQPDNTAPLVADLPGVLVSEEYVNEKDKPVTFIGHILSGVLELDQDKEVLDNTTLCGDILSRRREFEQNIFQTDGLKSNLQTTDVSREESSHPHHTEDSIDTFANEILSEEVNNQPGVTEACLDNFNSAGLVEEMVSFMTTDKSSESIISASNKVHLPTQDDNKQFWEYQSHCDLTNNPHPYGSCLPYLLANMSTFFP